MIYNNSEIKELDNIDKKILELLIENSRNTYRTISEYVNVSESTVRNRIIKLNDKKVIKKFTIKIDLEKLDSSFGWILKLNIDPFKISEIVEILIHLENIISIYEISGEENLILMGYNRSFDSFKKFLVEYIYSLHGILGIKSEILINEVK